MPKNATIRSAHDAVAVLSRKGKLTLSELVTAVAGQVKGSWWSHPKGALIYRIATELENRHDVLVTRWVDGKVTFVHRAMWPALYRVVTDEGYRRQKRARLSDAAKKLLQRVEREGEVHPESKDKRAREELEKSLLVRSFSVHTESGRHASVLASWARSVPDEVVKEAGAIDFEAAMLELFGSEPEAKRARR